jgi:hypothetical protein
MSFSCPLAGAGRRGAMSETLSRPLVLTILRHAEDFPWRVQDFTSTVIVGELTNTRYREDPAGDDYVRFRYSPGLEDLRRLDTVRLSGTRETFTAGQQYRQLASELHGSAQLPGTVTVIRCSWVGEGDLTVCHRDEGSWRSGRARAATRDEIKMVAARALEWF